MNVDTKFPGTLEERLALGPDMVRMPASWQEYLDLLEDCAYPIEYDNQEIVFMSIASDLHEVLVMNIGTCLNNIFADMPHLAVRGSNRHIFIPEFEKDYAPDAHVIEGEPAVHQLRKGLSANTNPWLVVEVLSPSTFVRDVKEKLPAYKKIASLRHILYIHQERPLVTVFNRVGESAVWETIDYDRLEDAFTVAGQAVVLSDVYKKVVFDQAE
ncbi:MAG: Uma2 family endonuclease [Saprospiraceae bacterium]|nr:Uma2 family endonuclease [Saprospiraceae bacterium]